MPEYNWKRRKSLQCDQPTQLTAACLSRGREGVPIGNVNELDETSIDMVERNEIKNDSRQNHTTRTSVDWRWSPFLSRFFRVMLGGVARTNRTEPGRLVSSPLLQGHSCSGSSVGSRDVARTEPYGTEPGSRSTRHRHLETLAVRTIGTPDFKRNERLSTNTTHPK
eukprot:6598564-Prymnesium_polylepis.2